LGSVRESTCIWFAVTPSWLSRLRHLSTYVAVLTSRGICTCGQRQRRQQQCCSALDAHVAHGSSVGSGAAARRRSSGWAAAQWERDPSRQTNSVGGGLAGSIDGGTAIICETTAAHGTADGSCSTKAPPLEAPRATRGSAPRPVLARHAVSAVRTIGPSTSKLQHREYRSFEETATTA
jgi:hypothetical protein